MKVELKATNEKSKIIPFFVTSDVKNLISKITSKLYHEPKIPWEDLMKKLLIVLSIVTPSIVFANTEVYCGYSKYIYGQDKNLVEEARQDLNAKLQNVQGQVSQLSPFQNGLNVAICVTVTK